MYHPGRFRVCIQNYRPTVGEEKRNMSACMAYFVHPSLVNFGFTDLRTNRGLISLPIRVLCIQKNGNFAVTILFVFPL